MPRESTDTLKRQWALLRAIPRFPRSKSTTELFDALGRDFNVERRTVQRDLERLSRVFPIYNNQEGRANLWCWRVDAPGFEIPGMRPTTAVVLQLVKAQLRPLLPVSVTAELTDYFQRAGEVLNDSRFVRWPKCVRAIQRGPEQVPPPIPDEVRDTVYAALLEGKRFEVDYASRSKEQESRYLVNPLGLVTRNGVFYLVGTLWDYDDVRHLALHRMSNAELREDAATRHDDFDLDDYIRKERAFGYRRSKQDIKLKLRIRRDIAVHLEESPLSEDQRITGNDDDWRSLTATVADTEELRWWLLGFGAGVEVLGPKRLRDEFITTVGEMAAHYGVRGHQE